MNGGHALPFLPGNTFRDLTKCVFHRCQSLGFQHGFAVARRPLVGTGQDPLPSVSLSHSEQNQLIKDTPNLNYSTDTNTHTQMNPRPEHDAHDEKVLRFYGYFQQEVLHSPDEAFRIRPVVIYYHLRDDSMCVIEPAVENSGIPQGKLIKRQRLPKNQRGELYHWKDMNLSMNMSVFGTDYRITHCDPFTQGFMESQGIVLNDPESIPSDPYTTRRAQKHQTHITPHTHEHQLQRFLSRDRQVLRFFALWDDSDSVFREQRPVTLHYYLVDDSVEICERQEPNSGRDALPVLLHRQKIPKHMKPTAVCVVSCVLEVSPLEVQEYFSAADFRVGSEVTLLGRRLHLYDCDEFTRKYFQQNLPELQTPPTPPTPLEPRAQQDSRRVPVVPPYNGFGSLEDSLQNCLTLIPKAPKRDVMRLLENQHKILRYTAHLDSQSSLDDGRRFILSFDLSDEMISIFEKSTRNSGIIGGKFLEKTRVPKPSSSVENPEYYGPADFSIGASVEVFGFRFVLTDADRYVLSYLESVSDHIPESTLTSLRQKFGVQQISDPENKPPETTDETRGVLVAADR